MTLVELVMQQALLKDFEANGIILAGKVLVNNFPCTSIKYELREKDTIEIKYKKRKFVTRSGYKLEGALEHFCLDVTNVVCLDIGASEGGFTDCLLQRGASKVFAVDVAYGILNWKVRSDQRVVPVERMNARKIKFEDIGQLCDIITMDVSFISTRLILPKTLHLLKQGGEMVILFKPQFELDVQKVQKNGYVDKDDLIIEMLHYQQVLAGEMIYITDMCCSPIRGNNGTREFLMRMKTDQNQGEITPDQIREVVEKDYE